MRPFEKKRTVFESNSSLKLSYHLLIFNRRHVVNGFNKLVNWFSETVTQVNTMNKVFLIKSGKTVGSGKSQLLTFLAMSVSRRRENFAFRIHGLAGNDFSLLILKCPLTLDRQGINRKPTFPLFPEEVGQKGTFPLSSGRVEQTLIWCRLGGSLSHYFSKKALDIKERTSEAINRAALEVSCVDFLPQFDILFR